MSGIQLFFKKSLKTWVKQPNLSFLSFLFCSLLQKLNKKCYHIQKNHAFYTPTSSYSYLTIILTDCDISNIVSFSTKLVTYLSTKLAPKQNWTTKLTKKFTTKIAIKLTSILASPLDTKWPTKLAAKLATKQKSNWPQNWTQN